MRELDPKIEWQEIFAQQIFNVLQGDVINDIRTKCQGFDLGIRNDMEGNSLKVNENLLPQFYALCEEVKERLGFTEKIEFYITGNSEVNACAIYSENEQCPHIIDINSALFKLMNQEEIKYVVGHEIGHLINKDAIIKKLFNFVYPDEDAVKRCPDFLVGRIKMYNQIAELGADRYGYLANENLDSCVTAIYKLASGLDLEKMNVSIDSLLAENDKSLEFFVKGGGVSEGSHPVNPIRIHALELFAQAKTQAALNRGMSELYGAIQNFVYDELDYELGNFVAAASIIVTSADGKRDKNEEEFILKELAAFCPFPHKVLKHVEKGDVMKVFNDSVSKILEINPRKGIDLLNYFINVAFADGELDEKEIELINDFGEKLGFSEFDIARAIGIKVQENFFPKASALK